MLKDDDDSFTSGFDGSQLEFNPTITLNRVKSIAKCARRVKKKPVQRIWEGKRKQE